MSKQIAENGTKLDPKLIERVSKQMQMEADAKERVEKCGKEIQAVLAKFNCQLAAYNVIRPDGSAAPNVTLQALPTKE